MEINILKLIPREWNIKNLKDKVKIYYKTKGRGNSPKPIILPKIIKIDKKFMEACAMYLGDGKLSSDEYHLDFTNKDKDLVKFMLNFFLKRLNLKKNNIRYTLIYKKLRKNMINDWSNYLKLQDYKINIKKSERHKEECFGMQVSSKLLRIIFERILNKLLNINFKESTELRRAFLRGLFAAEGSIAISRKENYIVYMGFFLHQKEKNLAKLCCDLLKKENISYKIRIKEKTKSLEIITTNWKNYFKYWNINLFDLNKRKKNTFIKKLKHTKFQCIINNVLLYKLLNSSEKSHRQLAFKTNIKPERICHLNTNKTRYLNIEELIKLANHNKINIDIVKNSIKKLRVNCLTHINKNKEFIDLIFNLKEAMILDS